MNILCYFKVVSLSPIGGYVAFVIASLITTGKTDLYEVAIVFIAGGYIVSFVTALVLGLPYLVVQSLRPLNAWIWLPILMSLGGIGGYFIHSALSGRSTAKSFMVSLEFFTVIGASVAFMAWLMASILCKEGVDAPNA
ncbi:hypothetical protein [Thiobacillus sp.]|uniref:hypothetical protein n=1 Tax=Thiobacillus sp. TaxID=924 RepID=UPI0025F561A2|nr:hypothetical protein [Thiobacillus sp.]MBT9539516.1 hypothetical protein [Thiobacillus sp.]